MGNEPKTKRIRTRSLKMQLAIALKDAEIAATSKDTDEYTIARMRLLQTRLKILSVKEARERASKWKGMQAEITSLKAENASLRAENDKFKGGGSHEVPASRLDCGETTSDEALDQQVKAMMEQLKCDDSLCETKSSQAARAPTPAPAPKAKSAPLIFPWRSPEPSPTTPASTPHEPGDFAPRIAKSDVEQQAIADLHRDVRFSQRSVAEKVAKIEREARELKAIQDQSDI